MTDETKAPPQTDWKDPKGVRTVGNLPSGSTLTNASPP